MIIVSLLAGLTLVALSAALGTRALAFGRIRAADRLRTIEMYGTPRVAELDDEDVAPSWLDRTAERTGTLAAGAFPRLDIARIRQELLSAGSYGVSAERFLGYRVLAAAVLAPFVILEITRASLVGVVTAGIAAFLAWRLPSIMLRRRAVTRREQIDRELPELIDLLIVGIEAGVGLSAAQQLIAGRLEGPLGSEMRLVMQQESMGLSNDQALTNLLERCDTPSVWSYVRALQQGERLGVSIGTTLRNLAVEMRTRRRQLAEERAQKAPVKMLFPLVFLILPALFIVLLGPAALTFQNLFGG